MNMIAKRGDFDILVKHGIIEEVDNPKWTDANLLEFSNYYHDKRMQGVNKTKAEILKEFKILKDLA